MTDRGDPSHEICVTELVDKTDYVVKYYYCIKFTYLRAI